MELHLRRIEGMTAEPALRVESPHKKDMREIRWYRAYGVLVL